MKKVYDTLHSVNLADITNYIQRFADSGWRVHTFIYAREGDHLPSHWVALMERDNED